MATTISEKKTYFKTKSVTRESHFKMIKAQFSKKLQNIKMYTYLILKLRKMKYKLSELQVEKVNNRILLEDFNRALSETDMTRKKQMIIMILQAVLTYFFNLCIITQTFRNIFPIVSGVLCKLAISSLIQKISLSFKNFNTRIFALTKEFSFKYF